MVPGESEEEAENRPVDQEDNLENIWDDEANQSESKSSKILSKHYHPIG